MCSSDLVGGGFCRYAVDELWMIPHFEKMLYDNGALLAAIADAWANRRGEVVESSRRISEALGQSERLRAANELLTPAILGEAFQFISAQFDDADGGLGGAPKFPQPMIWEFALRYWKRTQNTRARQTAHTTLTMMARGGMYDQIGGGFHRYSVDAHWLVPHFEKMLYDNGALLAVYAQADRKSVV